MTLEGHLLKHLLHAPVEALGELRGERRRNAFGETVSEALGMLSVSDSTLACNTAWCASRWVVNSAVRSSIETGSSVGSATEGRVTRTGSNGAVAGFSDRQHCHRATHDTAVKCRVLCG